MKLSEYLNVERGRGVLIARVMGVAPQQVYQWASGDRPIPADRCPDVEEATNGEVRCEDLRPDVNWYVVRRAAAPKTVTAKSRRKTNKQ